MTRRLAPGSPAPDFTLDTPHEKNLGFRDSAGGSVAALFFLRYAGCPLCQMKISELRSDADSFARAGCRLFAVLQSDPAVVREALGADMPFTIICDPRERIFGLYGVKPGGILGYIAPSVIIKAVKAAKGGFRHGRKEGRELQVPAVFIVDGDGIIAFAHYGKNIGDLPGNGEILAKLEDPDTGIK